LTVTDYEIADDSYYLYASAILKTREHEFIEKAKLDRMATAVSAEQFLKIFSETYYSKYFGLISREKNFDELIIENNREILKFLKDNLKDDDLWVLGLIMYEENIHNYKLLLKAVSAKADFSTLFLPSIYNYDTLLNEAQGRNYEQIDLETEKFIELINSLKDSGYSWRKIELELEKAYFKNLIRAAKKSKSSLMKDFICSVIDIINIKNISRVKYIKENIPFEDFIIEGGSYSADFLKKFESTDAESFIQEFKGTQYAEISARGTNTLTAHGTFASFEKNEYIFYLAFFKSVRYSVSNLEKIFSFFMRKKVELKIMNMIYMGILYGVEEFKVTHKAEILNEN